jgi:hypothetical protein
MPMWLILLEKTRQAQRAAQQLDDCFLNDNRAGQFLSGSRSAAQDSRLRKHYRVGVKTMMSSLRA